MSNDREIFDGPVLKQTLRHLIRMCVRVDSSITDEELWNRPALREALYQAKRHAADMLHVRRFEAAVEWERKESEK